MANEVEQIQFALGLNTDKFSKSLRDIDKEMQKITKRDLKVPALDPKNLKRFKTELRSSVKETNILYKTIAQGSRKHSKLLKNEVREYQKAHRRIEDLVEKHTVALNEIRKSGDKDRIKQAEKTAGEEIRIAKRSLKEQQNIFQNKVRKTGGLRVVRAQQEKAAKTQEFRESLDKFRWGDAGRDVGEAFKDAVSSLSAKDLAGAAKGFFSMGGRALKGVTMGAAKFAQDRKGESGAMGAVARVIGKMGPAMEGIVRTVSTLGPMMSLFSSAIVGIVKLMIDVEAKAKEINKELLEGSSLAETFAAAGNNSRLSYMHLSDTLQTVKDQAADIEMNFAMGTAMRDHLNVIKTLTKEGLTFESLRQKIDAAKQAGVEQTAGMQSFQDITKMSIGYSRIFGVSLDEIGALQGEMMTNMGASLKDMKLEFGRMTDAAVESGIASNKFFAILRGVSTDLGLYGVRLGEVTKMLKQLGKVMSPKMAQRFLGEFAKGMTEFSTDDRLKMVLLGGPGAVDDIKKNLQQQKDDLLKKIAQQAGIDMADAQKLLEGGTVGGKDFATIAKEKGFGDQVGTMKEAYLNTKRGLKAASTEGVYGAAQGAKYLDAFASYQMKKKAALGISGKKSLEESIGIRGEKAAEVAGVGGDKFDALLGMERAIDQQRQDLVNAFENPNPTDEQKKLIALAQKAGIMDAKMAKEAPDRSVWQSMQDDEADAKKHADEQLKAAYESGKLTQSMLDKLDVVIDGIFNWLYKMMNNIWDSIVEIWAGLPGYLGGDAGKKYKAAHSLEKAVMDARNDDIRKAFDVSGGDPYKMKDALLMGAGSAGGRLSAGMSAANTEFYGLEEKLKTAKPEEQNAIKKRMADLMAAKSAAWNAAMTGPGGATSSQQVAALGMVQGNKKFDDLRAYMEAEQKKGRSDISIQQAMQEKGVSLSGEEQNELIGKALWAMSPDQLAKVMPTMLNAYKGAGIGSGSAMAGTVAASPVAAAPGVGTMPAGKPEPPVTSEQGDKQIAAVEDVGKGLKTIKLDKPFLNGPFDKAMRNSVLEAMRQALWEYYLYNDIDKTKMLNWVKNEGMDITDGSAIAQANASWFAPKNAAGTGPMIGKDSMGFAKFAPSEAPTSIGLGEKIVRSDGAGGGGLPPVTLHVNGFTTNDFNQYLVGVVNKAIYDYKLRMKRTGG